MIPEKYEACPACGSEWASQQGYDMQVCTVCPATFKPANLGQLVWHLASDGMPTESGTYLVMLRPDNSIEYTSENAVSAEFDFWPDKPKKWTVYDADGNDDVTEDVTHWMPLPTPPAAARAAS